MEKNKKIGFDPLMIIVLIGAALIAVLEIMQPKYVQETALNKLISTAVTRYIGVIIFIPMAFRTRYNVYGFTKTKRLNACLITIPAFLVVINNLPIIGLVTGACVIKAPELYFWVYTVESLSIGLFEEFAFRGVLLPLVLEKRRGSTKQIFWATVLSSAVFGLVHLVNLAVGSDPFSVILQIGYSFLIGGMCAVVLLRTKCIWLCVILHTLFDFCGYLLPTLGNENHWDIVTVTITAVLGWFTLIHCLFVMKETKPEDIKDIFRE